MKRIYDTVIVGGGPGGYTAALYAARAGLQTLVLEKLSAGGQMALTHMIDNYPGFHEGIDGFDLGEQMRLGAERFGAETEYAEVLSLDLGSSPKRIETDSGTVLSHTVIIATGANPKQLGLENEQLFTGRGVHYCASCDGNFYRNKTVVLVGGGNSAAADALILSRIAKKVILVHRRDTLRATKIYHEPLMQAENVQILWNSAVTQLLGTQRLSAVKIKNLLNGSEEEISVDGLFVSIGRSPATELVKGQLALDDAGYMIADETTRTNIDGVFAVGDARTKPVRQVVTATADGANAIHFAQDYLAQL